ncbi:MAG: alpha-ribazole phosphatase [Deltaproteobacteria bacterium]|nr:alpha-ribazole phosphatase [Deltaproteobacteria bacterium]
MTLKAMSTKVILIRHGETDWSYQKRYCGFTDIGLNEKGRQQARRLHKRLTKEKVHKIYSSNMKRTVQFAKIVFKDVSIKEMVYLREMNFGIFEGLTYQDIMEKYPRIYRNWLENPLDIIIPRGESLRTLARRVRKALKRILSQNSDKKVAVFTHGGPIRVILCDILKLDLKGIWKIEQELASISIIEFVEGRGKVYLLNDISYLHG